MERVSLEISWGSLWRVLVFVSLVGVLFLGRNIILGLFLAIVISAGLDRFITFFEKRGFPRVLAVISTFVAGALFLVILLYTVVPLLITDIRSVTAGFSVTVKSLGLAPLVNQEAIESINNLIGNLSDEFLTSLGSSPLSALSRLLGGLGLALSVFISSFYLTLTRDGVQRFIRAVFPTDYEEPAIRIFERSRKQIALWFQNQILLSVIMGALVWIVLVALGVKHAFILAVLTAVFEIVPYIGPIMAGAAAVLVALGNSVTIALYTLIAFLVIQQFENHVLVPVLTKRAIGLHPVIVITALLIGIEVGGFLGLVISVPAAAVFQEVIDEWSSKKKPRAAV